MRQLVFFLTFICCCAAFGQNFYPPLVNYSPKDFGKNKNAENYCAVQDQRGVMFFGTSNGVFQFNGEEWGFIKVPGGSYVRSLAIDTNGTIYCGAYGNFGYLKPNGIGGLVFKSLSNNLPEEDQFFSNVWRIHTTADRVYFQSEEALFIYTISSGDIEVVYPENSFHTCFLVGDDLILRERGVGLVTFKNDMIEPLKGTAPFADYGVFGVHALADDSLLIITQELGLYKWKNGGLRHLPDPNPIPLTSLGVFGSVQLSDGSFALNSFTNGVIITDENGKILRSIDRNAGIRSDVVQQVYQDRDLNLWLSLGDGIAKVNYYSPLSFFNDKTGIEGNVEAIIRYKGSIYIGTVYGLFVQDSLTYGARKFRNTNWFKEQVWDFCEVDGVLYIATANGVFKTADGAGVQRLSHEGANTICYRPNQQEFVTGGAKGVFVYDRFFNEIWAQRTNFSNFLGSAVDPENENNVWLGTVSTGVLKLTDLGGGNYEVNTYGDLDGLTDDMGTPVLFEGNLVFGGKDGLYYFVDEDEMKVGLSEEELKNPENYKGVFDRYVLRDSVFNGQIFLLEKAKDRIWYCNEYKIGFYDEDEKAFRNRPFWGIDYGRINTFYLEEDGVLWIGAAEGVIRFEDNRFKQYHSDFYAIITQVRTPKEGLLFNGVHLDEHGQFTMEQTAAEVPTITYRNNDIEFAFSAPYFEDEHRPEYRFKLEGHDDDWSVWKAKSEASYNNMHEGEYVFTVEARNIYGQLSKQAQYRFVVLPPWYRTTWAYVLYVLLFILALVIGVRISSKRLKAKNLWLEGIVEERTREISQKNVVLEHQKQEIEDSINYAQRIQEAILPLADEIKKWIPDSFVLFRPKDIVSGDFYWFLERDDKLIFICADCTGHGVPGAFMSMIGSDRLNNIVSERRVTSPALILSELNRAIKKSLKQDGQKNSTRDGMDAAVCTVDLKEGVLQYAGANRPLWIVNQGEFKEIKATKVAVAGFTAEDQVYQEHTVTLEAGMKFYMTTDGYADQFGGERNKKFKVKNMKALIVRNSELSFDQQQQLLENDLLNWMGDFEQVDDICVVGFSIPTSG